MIMLKWVWPIKMGVSTPKWHKIASFAWLSVTVKMGATIVEIGWDKGAATPRRIVNAPLP